MQEQVLRFVSSLGASALRGESGASLRQFWSSLDAASAHERMEAIEQECEQVDASQW